MTAPYGHPGCVDLTRLFSMPVPLQREGIFMLIDMGEPLASIAARAGRPERDIEALAGSSGQPISHEKEWQV